MEMELEEGEELGKTLPEELLEKIIAMMPYPSIFKARLLSTAWDARFEPISLLDGEEERRVATSFQKRVAEWSHNWDTFYPLCTTYPGYSVAYNQAMQKWQSLPFPPNLSWAWYHVGGTFSSFNDINLQLEGALLYSEQLDELYVTNVLTRESKNLPPPPEVGETCVRCMKLVISPSIGSYKVVLFCKRDRDYLEENWPEVEQISAQIYDSKSETWTSEDFVHSTPFEFADENYAGYAYLNGVLYMVAINNLHCLLAFNVEERTWEELKLSFTDEMKTYWVNLVVCYANLVVIVFEKDSETVHVLRIDLQSLRLVEVAQCPAALKLDVVSTRDMINTRVSQPNCLFFKPADFDNRIVEYNKLKDEWSFFTFLIRDEYHWSECTFQPGLNPFMAV